MEHLYLKQIEAGPMANYVYLVGDVRAKQCVMVDPAWEVDDVLELAASDGMEVIGTLVTHTHYDHINGAEDLIEKTNVKIYVHEAEAEAFKGLSQNIVPTSEGFTLRVGDLEIRVLHTPGHSPGSQCFLAEGHVFTGDTLFINACGRCDFPGGDSRKMFDSLQRLGALPGETVVLPGHNYAEASRSTIREERKNNPYYQFKTEQDFLNAR